MTDDGSKKVLLHWCADCVLIMVMHMRVVEWVTQNITRICGRERNRCEIGRER